MVKGSKRFIRVANHFLKRVGIERPRIAVAGVNPHAGNMVYSALEIEIIAPAIEAIRAEDIDVTGPCRQIPCLCNAMKGYSIW